MRLSLNEIFLSWPFCRHQAVVMQVVAYATRPQMHS